jgi:hypothetical protein
MKANVDFTAALGLAIVKLPLKIKKRTQRRTARVNIIQARVED